MTTDLLPFQYNDSPIRATLVNHELRAVRNDVCKALDIGNPSQATADFIEAELVRMPRSEGIISTDPLLRGLFDRPDVNEVALVTEAGLYLLVFRSRKPEALAFTRWVAHEVLPALRKKRKSATPRTPRKGSFAWYTKTAAELGAIEWHENGNIARTDADALRTGLTVARSVLRGEVKEVVTSVYEEDMSGRIDGLAETARLEGERAGYIKGREVQQQNSSQVAAPLATPSRGMSTSQLAAKFARDDGVVNYVN